MNKIEPLSRNGAKKKNDYNIKYNGSFFFPFCDRFLFWLAKDQGLM